MVEIYEILREIYLDETMNIEMQYGRKTSKNYPKQKILNDLKNPYLKIIAAISKVIEANYVHRTYTLQDQNEKRIVISYVIPRSVLVANKQKRVNSNKNKKLSPVKNSEKVKPNSNEVSIASQVSQLTISKTGTPNQKNSLMKKLTRKKKKIRRKPRKSKSVWTYQGGLPS